MFIGPHIGFGDIEEFKKEVDKVVNLGGNIVQFFKHNMSDSDLNLMKQYCDGKMKIVIHSSYTHNIAMNWDKYSWWIGSIIDEIIYCDKINAFGLVLHFGKYMKLDISVATNNMFTSLLHIHNQTLKYENVKIILETPAGQGTEMCYKIEDLASFFKKFVNIGINKNIQNRFRICVDTCHIFSAGYDLRTKNMVKLYFDKFNEYVGMKYLALIHLNDNKTGLGSRLDRHELIGDGYIGVLGLRYIYEMYGKAGGSMILEIDVDVFEGQLNILKNKIK